MHSRLSRLMSGLTAAVCVFGVFASSLAQKSTTEHPDSRRTAACDTDVDNLAFSPDGNILAAASQIMELLDTHSCRSIARFRNVLLGLHSVCFSPDGKRLAAGSNGQEAIKIWDVDSHDPVATLEGQGSLFSWVAFSPDGNTIGARNVKGNLHLWRAPSWEEINIAEQSKNDK